LTTNTELFERIRKGDVAFVQSYFNDRRDQINLKNLRAEVSNGDEWDELTPPSPDLSTGDKNLYKEKRVIIENQQIEAARFHNVNLQDATFEDVNLARATFININLVNVTLTNVNLSGVQISDANIDGLTIDGIEIQTLLTAELQRRAALSTT
jgi:uncharacterized protein YjbI with pentapeptide repeats